MTPHNLTPRDEAVKRCEAVDRLGSICAAAREFDMNERAFSRSLESIKRHYGLEPEYRARLVTKGTSTLTDKHGELIQQWDKTRIAGRDPEEAVHLPDPKKITKVSTLYDQQGRVTQQWVSEKPEDVDREKLWRECAEAMAAELPRAAPVPMPQAVSADLCACYPVSDLHLGMYSWHRETGSDYDIAIAEELLANATEHLIKTAPPCKTAFIPILGDLLHYDSTEAVTPAHRNLLDADGRSQKMVEAGVRALRRFAAVGLEHHGHLHFVFEPGNHDPFSIMFLRILFSALFENEPRVTVDMSPGNFHYFEFGTCLIGTHHGHSAKMDKLPLIMASDRPEAWGRTKHRHWWTGHIHHRKHEDFVGCTVESFRILASPDAYAASHGYRSIRDMQAIILHREHGEVARHTVNPDMFKRAA